jgi:hypothetical protein
MNGSRRVREITRARAAIRSGRGHPSNSHSQGPRSLNVIADPTLVELTQRADGTFPHLE